MAKKSEMPKYSKDILTKYLPKDINMAQAAWEHKQSGQWIITHRAIEIMCAAAGIQFKSPEVHQADVGNGIFVILVEGTMALLDPAKEGIEGYSCRSEWSFGEASKANCKMQYPAAMAEKRAKDRVALKLLGLHGFVYSDVEDEDFKDAEKEVTKPVAKPVVETSKERANQEIKTIKEFATIDAFETWVASPEVLGRLRGFDDVDQARIRAECTAKRKDSEKKQPTK